MRIWFPEEVIDVERQTPPMYTIIGCGMNLLQYIKFHILFIEFVINTYPYIITFSFAYQSSLPHLDSKALKDNTHL